MPDITIVEKQWLGYARGVLTGEQCACGAQGADRWPGFVGENYTNGRLLIVGAIHNSRALLTAEMLTLQQMARSWAVHPRSDQGDAHFLSEVRSAYPKSMKAWIDQGDGKVGRVWANISRVLGIFGLEMTEVAFTNLAKCAAPPGASIDKRIIACNARFPILDLVGKIDPLVVVLFKDSWKTNKHTPVKDAGTPLPFENRCHNLNGLSDGLTIGQWAPTLARDYWTLRLTRTLRDRLLTLMTIPDQVKRSIDLT